ncbi:MAG: TauD/TfdA family dioxygenase [Verrucomicrobia bacterium]|nr:TauD/TfdA family dioxygenase [Verrucomicrobiota bacterium]
MPVAAPVKSIAVKAWRAASVDPLRNWYHPLPARSLAALDATIQELRRQPRPTAEVRLTDAQRAVCAPDLALVAHAIEHGRGFAVVRVPAEGYSKAELTTLYWLIGQALGRPFEQNVEGTILYDVTDKGQDLTKGARFSVTNYESSFHTDNSFGGDVLDYVGLLCLQNAKTGGVSQVMSGYAVGEELAKQHPAELEILTRPFHVDRRGGLRPGETPTAFFPVLQWNGDELLFRYLRYWIQAGHEKVGQPLTPAQVKALDTLDEVLKRRDLMAEFSLEPGDMYFINNRWILHNRTAFEDWPELERRRHLVRLWLQR